MVVLYVAMMVVLCFVKMVEGMIVLYIVVIVEAKDWSSKNRKIKCFNVEGCGVEYMVRCVVAIQFFGIHLSICHVFHKIWHHFFKIRYLLVCIEILDLKTFR